MKLIKTITKVIKEAEEAYNRASEEYVDEKTLEKLEKNYLESLRLMKIYKDVNSSSPTKKKK
jgi:hypothetical protein